MPERPRRCRVFVGRKNEMAALEMARRSLAKSRGSIVLLSGEAGIGKTRLLDEFVALVERGRSRNIFHAECRQRAQRPLGGIITFVRALARKVVVAELPRNVLRALVQVVPDELPPETVSANERFVLEREQLFEAFVALLNIVCAKRSTILTIEDLQWADLSTFEFLEYLARRIDSMRLLMVVTYRTDNFEDAPVLFDAISRFLRESSVNNVSLEPLPVAEIRALIDGTLGEHAVLAPSIMKSIEARSEGNPFFAEELVKHVVERDSTIEPAALPLSIRASIEARLARLTVGERAVLRYASVLGQRFEPSVLAEVMDCDIATLVPALQRCHDLNIVVDDDVRRGRSRFRHALMRQTIYDELLAFEVKRLHGRILSVLECRSDTRERIDELAYHAWESGDRTKALYYNERAGEAAVSVRALSEALVCFERALEAAVDCADEARILERVGNIHQLHGNFQRAVDAFDRAVELRIARSEFEDAGRLACWIVSERTNAGDAGAVSYAERFVERYGINMSQAARGRLLAVAARIACVHNDFSTTDRLLSLITDPAVLMPIAQHNYWLIQLTRSAHCYDVDAYRACAKQLEDVLPLLPPFNQVNVRYTIAQTGTFIGANDDVNWALSNAERIEREFNFHSLQLFGTAVRGVYAYMRGRLDELRLCVSRIAGDIEAIPARKVIAPFAALLDQATGDVSFATLGATADILRSTRSQLDDPAAILLIGMHAPLLAAAGEAAAARADLQSALRAIPFAAPEYIFVLIHAAQLLPLDDLSCVLRLAGTAAKTGRPCESALQTLIETIVASRTGEPRAQGLGLQAAEMYAKLGWPLIEAIALEYAGFPERALSIYEHCAAASHVLRLAPARRPVSGDMNVLSSRESEIVRLLWLGLRNAEIAAKLDVGTKTIEKNISSIFGKLGFRSRSQVTAFAAAEASAGRFHLERSLDSRKFAP